jgi:DNA-binding beta-propeller fold protein YncE
MRLRLSWCWVIASCASPVEPLTDASFSTDAAEIAADGGDAGGLPPIPVFAGVWGGYGTEPGQFIEPSSVELDSEGLVYVAGHEDRVQKFTREGELLFIWGHRGLGDGEFNHPHGLAVDRRRGDLVYVGDQENHQLQVFTKDGVFVRRWGDTGFKHIHDVGIDPESGDIFVGDYELHTLLKFSATGALIAQLGGPGEGPGEFRGVWGISTDSQGNVYVADTFNRRVQKLDRNGVFLKEWRTDGESEFTKPTGVFVDAEDIVYICDSLAERVTLFDPEGTPLQRWNLAEIFGGSSEPEDIVIDREGKHIYIGEVRFHRVIHLIRPD